LVCEVTIDYMPASGWVQELHVEDALGRGNDRIVAKFHQRPDCPRIHDVLALLNTPKPHDAVPCTLCASDVTIAGPRRDDPAAKAATVLA
jgi:hypothetical protein